MHELIFVVGIYIEVAASVLTENNCFIYQAFFKRKFSACHTYSEPFITQNLALNIYLCSVWAQLMFHAKLILQIELGLLRKILPAVN